MKLEDIAYAVNTFPKAFFVWRILEESPLRPIEMREKLEELFPELLEFSFLKKGNFAQYCTRSLSDFVKITDVNSGLKQLGSVPAYSLKDLSLKEYAALILSKSIELNTNPEDYLTAGGNTSKKANRATIDILLWLYEKDEGNVDKISKAIDFDYTDTYRHIEHLAETGLVRHTTINSDEEQVSYRWIKSKKAEDVKYDRAIKERHYVAMTKLVEFLPKQENIIEKSELAKRIGHSLRITKGALYDLARQGFAEKISHGKYSIAAIEEKGRKVVEQILMPMIEASEGRLNFEPTSQHLIYGMQMYRNKLNVLRP